KRHGLGLIRFIGELFKLNMLTERIMHECIKKLLTVHGVPEEEEMESLCKLMTTAAKAKEEAEILRRAASSGGRDQISRSSSGRRDISKSHGSSGQSVSSDGWSMVGGTSSASRQAGDLSKFGSVSRSKVPSGHVSLAPGGSAFASLAGGSKGWKTESKERKDKTEIDSSSSNESAKSFASPPPPERKKIILAPRSTSLPLSSETPPAPKSIMTKSSATSISMSEEVAERKINSTVEEYFNIGDINELPKEFYSKAIEIFANKALEKKQDDVDKVIRLFDKFIIENIVDKSVFTEGFTATVEFLIDIGADAPKSYTFTGQLFNGARLDIKDVSELLKPLSEIDDKGLEKVMTGYLTALKADTVIARKVKESGLDFKSIFPKKSITDINKFLEDLVSI
ncbi:2819_t:CDS:2, partial [Racocetra fulgida]